MRASGIVSGASLATVAAAATTISVPSSAPSNAKSVDPSFVGTSFELSTFQLYAQTSVSDTSANQYSINLINELSKRTGGRPIMRVGGTSGDTATWSPSLTQPISPAPGTSQTGHLTYGPNFWPLAKLLSSTNPLWVPQVSYTDTDPSHAEQEAQSIVNNIGWNNIAAIEIGNEPNEYGGHTGPSATGAQHFATNFQGIVSNISSVVSVPGGALWAGPGLASYDHHSTDWDTNQIFQTTDFDSRGNIKYATDHWYRCLGSACSYTELLSHSHMVSNVGQHIKPTVDYLATYNGGSVKYFLDEINILSGTANADFSHSFATALYGADWMMYLMTIGVQAVNWEQVYNSNQNLWQPSSSGTMAAQTKNTYYGLMTAAEFIGTGGSTKVVELSAGGGNNNAYFSAYAAYNASGGLARLALLNLNYWDVSTNTARPSPTVTVNGLPAGATSVTVKYLTNPNGAAQRSDQTTFGGSQWPFSNKGREKTNVQQTTVQAAVFGGEAQIVVPYSSIAIVYVQ